MHMQTDIQKKVKKGEKFTREFWIANFMELLERAAFYGFYISITLYLTNLVGFNDKETGVVAGVFVAFLYFLTPFTGAISDKIGFKNGLILAFALLTIGYAFLGINHTKIFVIFSLFLIAIGGSFIKSLVSGTVAKTTSEENRARGYSLFYWIVNIGSFTGKTFVPFLRINLGLEYVNYFSACLAFGALMLAVFKFKQTDKSHSGRTFKDVSNSLLKILTNPRLIIFIIIIAGFWTVQYQLYATMPKYVIRLLGDQAKPEWLANINPLIVVLFVVPITKMMKNRKAVTSIFIGMIHVPIFTFILSLGQVIQNSVGNSISIFNLFTMHPLTLMLIIGIAMQGFAECFISPRYLEYFSLLAPKGEEGVYMGFGYLYSFFAAIPGFILSGFLLDKYCPDPKTLPVGLTSAQKAVYYQGAYHIWYYFFAIGLLTALSLLLFVYYTKRNKSSEVVYVNT